MSYKPAQNTLRLAFDIISLHHMCNGARLLSPQTEYNGCLASC